MRASSAAGVVRAGPFCWTHLVNHTSALCEPQRARGRAGGGGPSSSPPSARSRSLARVRHLAQPRASHCTCQIAAESGQATKLTRALPWPRAQTPSRSLPRRGRRPAQPCGAHGRQAHRRTQTLTRHDHEQGNRPLADRTGAWPSPPSPLAPTSWPTPSRPPRHAVCALADVNLSFKQCGNQMCASRPSLRQCRGERASGNGAGGGACPLPRRES